MKGEVRKTKVSSILQIFAVERSLGHFGPIIDPKCCENIWILCRDV